MAHAAVSRAALKGLLRAAAKWDAKGWSTVPLVAALPGGTVPAAAAAPSVRLADAVRATFRAHAAAPAASRDGLLGHALAVLAAANAALAKDAAKVSKGAVKGASGNATAAAKAAAAAASKMAYGVGQVVQHRLYGYRAVVLGVDERCMAGKAWVEASGARRLKGGVAQPFYKVAVHVGDRAGAQVGYVAQENLALLSGGAALPVLHPLVHRYFASFSAGVYRPAAYGSDSDSEEEGIVPRATLA